MRNPPAPATARRSGRKPKGEAAQASAKKTKASLAEQARSAQAGAAPDLRDFTQAFFTLFGASVTPLDEKPHGPLQVTLSGDLAEHFGATTLGLAFQSVEPGSGHQLVAHGSRMFDRMIQWIERRGALTVRRLPAGQTSTDVLKHTLHARNASLQNLRLSEQHEPLYVFHWRITYRADDKREELYSVVLGEEGIALEAGTQPGGLPTLDDLLAKSEPAPVLPPPAPRRRPASPPTDRAPEPSPFTTALDAATGEEYEIEPVEPTEPTGAGEDIPPALQWPSLAVDDQPSVLANGQRLPPMTHLVRQAERARRFAVYHADLRCVDHEAEILPRLYKSVQRLSSYYSQQIEELAAGSTERQEGLQADLERKIAEEIENHRLRVHVELCGYAVLYVPAASADMTLTDGRAEAPVRIRLNRFSGALKLPECHACGEPITDLALCRSGHVMCDACLRQCGSCHEVVCAACGVSPCAVCEKALCSTCAAACRACGEAACAEHIGRCPTCGDEVCDNCRGACAECGTRMCRAHLRADAVHTAADGDAPRLICARCAVRCPGCAQFSTRLVTCALSGQRFCANCAAACVECGRTVGPGFFGRDSKGRAHCRECVTVCETCGALAYEPKTCHKCKKGCCGECALKCEQCGKTFCRDHAEVASGCGHVLCQDHLLACAIGGEPVCPKCSVSCAICERHSCAGHKALCKWCGRYYCSACVDAATEICYTCLDAATGPKDITMFLEPVAKQPTLWPYIPLMRWKKASNRDVTIYVGSNAVQSVVAVASQSKSGRWSVLVRNVSRAALERAKRER